MTEDQFRRALRAQGDAYVTRLDVAYGLLFATNKALIQAAHKSGISVSSVSEIATAENANTEAALEVIFAKYFHPQPVRVH